MAFLMIFTSIGSRNVVNVKAATNISYSHQIVGKPFTVFGVHHDGVWRWQYKSRDDVAFCIDPGGNLLQGYQYGKSQSIPLSDKQQELMQQVFYYIYGPADSHLSDTEYLAIQFIVWGIVENQFSLDVKSPKKEYMDSAKRILSSLNSKAADEYDKTIKRMREQADIEEQKKISFSKLRDNANSLGDNSTIKLKWSEKDQVYVGKKDDENKVLNYYDLYHVPNYPSSTNVTNDGDKIAIRLTRKQAEQAGLIIINDKDDQSKDESTGKTIDIIAKLNKEAKIAIKANNVQLEVWNCLSDSLGQRMITYGGYTTEFNEYVFRMNVLTEPDIKEVEPVSGDGSFNYHITINKIDSETGMGLAGSQFEILEDGIPIQNGLFTTDNNGQIIRTQTKEVSFSQAAPTEEMPAPPITASPAWANEYIRTDASGLLDVAASIDAAKQHTFTYTVREVYARTGYYLNQETFTGIIKEGETFSPNIFNDRTTGKIKVQKQDLETGKTPQGDATFEGAEYGLYASAPIVHPDGKTGVIYETNELAATGITDKNGEILFDTHNTGKWSGKPLLLGSYYIKEIVRSEGYELSVSGKTNSYTNNGSKEVILNNNGYAKLDKIYVPLDAADQRDLRMNISAHGLSKGLKGTLTGVPEGTKVYTISYTDGKVIDSYLDSVATFKVEGNESALRNLLMNSDGTVSLAFDDDSGEFLGYATIMVKYENKTKEDVEALFWNEENQKNEYMGHEITELSVKETSYDTHETIQELNEMKSTYKDGTLTFESAQNDGTVTYTIRLPEGYLGTAYNGTVLGNVEGIYEKENNPEDSYIEYISLPWPGQTYVSYDADTLKTPIVVKERVIKQALEIYKEIDEQSTWTENTYLNPDLSKFDENSVESITTMSGFGFQVFLLQDLINSGLKKSENGEEWDFINFDFEKETVQKKAVPITEDGGTTIYANSKAGSVSYYARTIPIPYGTYVIYEVQPKRLPNKQFMTAEPKIVEVPFLTSNVSGQYKDYDSLPVSKYIYHDGMTSDEILEKFGIHWNPANSKDGEFEKAFVPWAINVPKYADLEDYDNLIGYNRPSAFQNQLYKTYLKIEKKDNDTGENILHSDAIFKLYKAKRDDEGNVLLNEDGTFSYDEKDIVGMLDSDGKKVEYFKAFSTGKNGYLVTPKRLGSGVYILVEKETPDGYSTADPIAIMVYSDDVTYISQENAKEDQESLFTENGKNYASLDKEDGQIIGIQSAKIVTEKELLHDGTYDVADIMVYDNPLKVAIHKVEDGEETITYQVEGTEQELLARKDVEPAYDDGKFLGYGTTTKIYDEFSKTIVEGKEDELISAGDVRLIYNEDGSFTGQGEKFNIYVDKAEITLYHGILVDTDTDGNPTGVTNSITGESYLIETKEIDGVKRSFLTNVTYDYVIKYVGSTAITTKINRKDYSTGDYDTNEEVYSDELVDVELAMENGVISTAKDDFGRTYVYPLNESGDKQIYGAIVVLKDEAGNSYIYLDGEVIRKDAKWITSKNDTNAVTFMSQKYYHLIERIKKGYYIVEETLVPYDDGYIQADPLGIEVVDNKNLQNFFLKDDFTKIELSKLDITSEKEIKDATITIYTTKEEKVTNEDGTTSTKYVKDEVYTSWVSGYLYDDDGNPLNQETDEPHWIDHIPVGTYIMEETIVPYKDGYVKSNDITFEVKETGVVQQVKMYDDYTAVEIHKLDALTKKSVKNATLSVYKKESYNPEHPGEPYFTFITSDGSEVKKDSDGNYIYEPYSLVDNAKAYVKEDGSLHITYLPVGEYVLVEENTPFKDGYVTAASMDFKVEDIGSKVETQQVIMDDYPTDLTLKKVDESKKLSIADAKLSIYRADVNGKLIMIQDKDDKGNLLWKMDQKLVEKYANVKRYHKVAFKDENLKDVTYYTDHDGNLYLEEKDGAYYSPEEGTFALVPDCYMLNDAGEKIPQLIPDPKTLHMTVTTEKDFTNIKYLPVGKYVLVEATTPSGLLRADNIPFEIKDTKEEQIVTMTDRIPNGRVIIKKVDGNNQSVGLNGAVFSITNVTTKEIVDTIKTKNTINATDDGQKTTVDGIGISKELPIGYINEKGQFVKYQYQLTETSAPSGYRMDSSANNFTLDYVDDVTAVIPDKTIVVKNYKTTTGGGGGYVAYYNIVVSKQNPDGKSLPGATLVLKDKNGKEISRWTTTTVSKTISVPSIGEYTIEEVGTPDGYIVAKPVTVNVKNVGNTYATVVDQEANGQVIITKTDEKKHPLKGVVFEIYNRDTDDLVDTFTTNTKGIGTSKKLPIMKIDGNGNVEKIKYLLVEKRTISGYILDTTPINFSFKATDGKTEVVTYKHTVINEKKPDKTPSGEVRGKAVISKTDIGGEEIAGAKLVVTDKKGNVIDKWMSNNTSHVIKNLKPGTYILSESYAPYGFVVANSVTFTINKDGKTAYVQMVDDVVKGKVSILKVNDDKKPLAGATFEIRDAAGNVIDTIVTNESGEAISKKLDIGSIGADNKFELTTYQLVEVKAPKGYKKLKKPITFTFEYKDDKTPIVKYGLTVLNKKSHTPEVITIPKTGDKTPILIYSFLPPVSLAIIVFFLSRKKYNKKKNK